MSWLDDIAEAVWSAVVLTIIVLAVISVGMVVTTMLSVVAPAQGTVTEQTACYRDALRFCRHTLSGGPFTVKGCLAANKPKLSAACRAVLTSYGM